MARRRRAGAEPAGLGSNYHRLWAASGFSNLADGAFQVSLALLVVRLTRSPTLVATVTLAGRLPWLVFALHAGALADRLDRRRTMTAVNAARGTVIAVVAALVAADATELWMLYVAAFALGIGETLFDTAAQSIMPMVVPDHQLSRANSRLYTVELTMQQFVGPPLGSLLVSAAIVAAFGASAAAYVLAAAALATIAGRYRVVRTGPATTIRADIAEGLRYLLAHRVLRTFMAMSGLINGASSAVLAVLPLYAVGPESSLGLSEAAFGFLLTASAVGSVIGSLVAHRIERRLGRVNAVALAAVVCGSALAVPALWPSIAPTALALMASGMFFIVWNVVTVSLRQRITPPGLLGRINAGYRLVALGSIPVGAAAGGLLAEAVGIRSMFLVMGVAGVLTVAGRLFVTDADIDAASAAVASQAAGGDAAEPDGAVAASTGETT